MPASSEESSVASVRLSITSLNEFSSDLILTSEAFLTYIGEPLEHVIDVPFNTIVTSSSSPASTISCPSDKRPATVYSPAFVIVYTEPDCVTPSDVSDFTVKSPVMETL